MYKLLDPWVRTDPCGLESKKSGAVLGRESMRKQFIVTIVVTPFVLLLTSDGEVSGSYAA